MMKPDQRGVLRHRTRGLVLALTGAGFAAPATAAPTFITDSFNRGSVAAPQELNGSAPTARTGTGNWSTAAAHYQTNGSAAVTNSAISAQDSASIAFAPLANGVSVYSVTLTPDTTGTAGQDWIAFGVGNIGSAAIFQLDSAFVLYTNAGTTAYFNQLNAGNAKSGGTALTPGTPDRFTITLNDTNPAAPTVNFSDSLGLLGIGGTTESLAQADFNAIVAVNIGRYDGVAGETAGGRFTLLSAATPEPTVFGTVALGVAMLVRRARPRRGQTPRAAE